MVYFTLQDALELFGGNEGRQAMDYLVKQARICGYQASREFLIVSDWYPEPRGREIEGLRYNIGPLVAKVENISGVWRYIKTASIECPAKPDKILEQLTDIKLKPGKLRVFSPWGPRYNKNAAKIIDSDPETQTLKEVKETFRRFKSCGYDIDFTLMPADVYGTEINGLSGQFVNDYFKYLGEAASGELDSAVDMTVKPWSAIRAENYKLYAGLRRDAEENFVSRVKAGEFQKAVMVARNFSPGNPEESAKRYCIERMVEAELIADLYDPIKLSLVRKEKDALDGPLKRIYIIKNRAPWMEGE